MRSVYARLGLVKRRGPDRVEAACARALEAEAISVPLIGRMIERATENLPIQAPLPGIMVAARFARDPSHFAVQGPKAPPSPIDPPPPEGSGANTEDASDAISAGGAR